MKTYFFFFLMMLAGNLLAQNTIMHDVHLKNGSVIRGKIMEITSEKVKIQLGEDVASEFLMSEVEKVMPVETAAEHQRNRDAVIKTKGFFNETEIGLMVNSASDESKFNTAYSVQNVSGYQVNRYFKAGGGIGLDHYFEYSQTFIPLFARVSGDIVKYRVTPVYFMDAGYGFLAGKNESGTGESSSMGGLMAHGGLGVKFYTASKISISLLIGFKVQRSEREYVINSWGGEYPYQEERIYRRHTFRMGICF